MKSWTRSEVAKTIDHAVLKPQMTDWDVVENCRLGMECGVASVCVRPSDVALAARTLADSPVLVSAVVGFPHGASRPEVKALEARLCIEDGAKELDMVMNIGKFLSGDFRWVKDDIEAVVAEARPKDVLVKVILEICYLTPEQIARACEIARDAGADFVKTSTGFGDGSATAEAVAVMVQTVGRDMMIKASGGVRTYAEAVAFLEQGCSRIGTSGGTRPICEGAPGDSTVEY